MAEKAIAEAEEENGKQKLVSECAGQIPRDEARKRPRNVQSGCRPAHAIPPETFHYRLGNRSALEWVKTIADFRLPIELRRGCQSAIRDPKLLSDPNRSDDPEHVVGQVVRVSVETVAITSLPKDYGGGQ